MFVYRDQNQKLIEKINEFMQPDYARLCYRDGDYKLYTKMNVEDVDPMNVLFTKWDDDTIIVGPYVMVKMARSFIDLMLLHLLRTANVTYIVTDDVMYLYDEKNSKYIELEGDDLGSRYKDARKKIGEIYTDKGLDPTKFPIPIIEEIFV